MIVQTDPIIADIGATSATFEAANFADQLLRVLRAANINAISSGNVNSQQQGLFTGVMAQFTTGNKKGEEFARAVASTLNDEGIFTLLTDGRYEALFHGPQAWNRDDPRVESVAIAVGTGRNRAATQAIIPLARSPCILGELGAAQWQA